MVMVQNPQAGFWPRPATWNEGSNPEVRCRGQGGTGVRFGTPNASTVLGGGGGGGAHAYNGSVPWNQPSMIAVGYTNACQFGGNGTAAGNTCICSAGNGSQPAAGTTGGAGCAQTDSRNWPTTNRFGGANGGNGTAGYGGNGGGGAGASGNASGTSGGPSTISGVGNGGNGGGGGIWDITNIYSYGGRGGDPGGGGGGTSGDIERTPGSGGGYLMSIVWIEVAPPISPTGGTMIIS